MLSSFTLPFALPTTVTGLLILAIALIILWVIVSIPVYAAGKVITDGRSGLGDAMGATLGGAIAYFIVLYGVSFFLGFILGGAAVVLAFILALLAWLAIYRAAFETSWLGAIGIVVVAWLVFFILNIFLSAIFGIQFPKFYPF